MSESTTRRIRVWVIAPVVVAAAQPAAAQPGWVLSHQKISSTEGGFTEILDDGDLFGWSAASLGDLDGDGVGDLGLRAVRDDDGDRDRCGARHARPRS